MNRRELILLLGGVMAAARDLRAQQKVTPVIGYLSGTSPGSDVVCGWMKCAMSRACIELG
jgi:hypothetical protein